MRLLIQKVRQAKVEVDEEIVGSIGSGLLVFIGVTHADNPQKGAYLASKLLNLRIFPDQNGKMNLSLLDTQNEVLIVSQFTLYADCAEGRRPSFTQAAGGAQAEELYLAFIQEVRKSGLKVETGRFGALMQVSLINDGPATFLLESK